MQARNSACLHDASLPHYRPFQRHGSNQRARPTQLDARNPQSTTSDALPFNVPLCSSSLTSSTALSEKYAMRGKVSHPTPESGEPSHSDSNSVATHSHQVIPFHSFFIIIIIHSNPATPQGFEQVTTREQAANDQRQSSFHPNVSAPTFLPSNQLKRGKKRKLQGSRMLNMEGERKDPFAQASNLNQEERTIIESCIGRTATIETKKGKGKGGLDPGSRGK